MSQPAGNKRSLKGAWSESRDQLHSPSVGSRGEAPVDGLGTKCPISWSSFRTLFTDFDCKDDQNLKMPHSSPDSWPVFVSVGRGALWLLRGLASPEAESLFLNFSRKFALLIENVHAFYCILRCTYFSLVRRLSQHNKMVGYILSAMKK